MLMLQTKTTALYYGQALNQFNRAQGCWCVSCELICAHARRFQISHACCVFDRRVLLQRDVSLRLSGRRAAEYSPFISESTQYEQICGLNPQPWTENGLDERCLCLKLFPSRSASKTMRTTANRDGDWSLSFIPGLSFHLFVVEMIVELVCSAVALLLYMNTLSADFCYDDRYSPPSLHLNS